MSTTVALRVRELAEERGLDLQEMASRTGLDPETAERLYNGEPVEIDLTTLGRLSELFGVLPNELVAEVIEPQPSVIDTGEMPRSVDVHTQDLDEVKKEPTGAFDDSSKAERLDL
jgi:transcriptional regulator with XRE-family HTH domain